VREQGPESRSADGSAPDVLVAIEPAATRGARIVEMEEP
jgi:hypothetical protein